MSPYPRRRPRKLGRAGRNPIPASQSCPGKAASLISSLHPPQLCNGHLFSFFPTIAHRRHNINLLKATCLKFSCCPPTAVPARTGGNQIPLDPFDGASQPPPSQSCAEGNTLRSRWPLPTPRSTQVSFFLGPPAPERPEECWLTLACPFLGAPNLNLTAEEKRVYGQLFRQADTDNVGVVTGEIAVKFFEKTRLDSRVLGEVSLSRGMVSRFPGA